MFVSLKHLKFILLSLLLIGNAAEGANLNKEEMGSLLKKYQFVGAISGQFEQSKKIKELDITLKSSGIFKVTRDQSTELVEWKINKPEEFRICIDSQALYLKDKNMKQPLRHPMDQANTNDPTGFSKLQYIFKNDIESLSKEFAMKKNGNEIILSGKNTMALTLDKQGFVQRVKITEAQGDESTILFKKVTLDKKARIEKTCQEVLK